jgi:hypothetical protein
MGGSNCKYKIVDDELIDYQGWPTTNLSQSQNVNPFNLLNTGAG